MLAPRLNAVHFNADEVRANVNKDLGFSEADRIEQARRMGWLCDQVVKVGGFAIADFICPAPAMREAFIGEISAFVIFVDRIKTGAFEDTNRMFVPPGKFDLRVTAEGTPEFWAEEAMKLLRPVFDPKQPTALFVGRYQPFHDGHKALIAQGIRRVGQVCIAVRDTHGTDAKNPFAFEHERGRGAEHGRERRDVRPGQPGDDVDPVDRRGVRRAERSDRAGLGDRSATANGRCVVTAGALRAARAASVRCR